MTSVAFRDASPDPAQAEPPGATKTAALEDGVDLGSDRTNSVAPAAAPMTPTASATFATVCCVLPEEISPSLSDGHGPPWHALLKSLYVERAMMPVTANVAMPATPTPPAT